MFSVIWGMSGKHVVFGEVVEGLIHVSLARDGCLKGIFGLKSWIRGLWKA